MAVARAAALPGVRQSWMKFVPSTAPSSKLEAVEVREVGASRECPLGDGRGGGSGETRAGRRPMGQVVGRIEIDRDWDKQAEDRSDIQREPKMHARPYRSNDASASAPDSSRTLVAAGPRTPSCSRTASRWNRASSAYTFELAREARADPRLDVELGLAQRKERQAPDGLRNEIGPDRPRS